MEETGGDTVLDELRDRIVSILSQNNVCVIATRGAFGSWAIPVQYENQVLELNCRLPRWSDAVFHIEQEPHVVAIIMHAQTAPLCWLQYRGLARIADSTDDRYMVIHIEPERIDLIDESHGRGTGEALDL